MADGEIVGDSSQSDDLSGESGDDDVDEERQLHNYFKFREYPYNIAVIFNDGERRPIRLNYGQVHDLARQVEQWVMEVMDGWCVGVCMDMNHLFPAVQIGIMRTGKAVCNISPDDYCETAADLKLKIILEYTIMDRNAYLENEPWINRYLDVVDKFVLKINQQNQFIFYALRFRIMDSCRSEGAGLLSKIPEQFEFAYVMQTTGTTGSRKTVLVPHSSIVPNIRDFIFEVWQCEGNDVVFGSSPATFDPAMVELFSALGSGASILYVPNLLKLDGVKIGEIFNKHKVTIFPSTPSLFRRLAVDFSKLGIFSANLTYLKVISFGGENCPSKEELRLLINEKMNSHLRAFVNVYGVTEVSCWASYCLVNPYDDFPISLGRPLSDTNIGLCYDQDGGISGEIVIESKHRLCTILNDFGIVPVAMNILSCRPDELLSNFSFRTGDIGSYNEFGEIHFEDRVDNIIKRSGMKVPLHYINEAAMKSGAVEAAHCVFFENKIYLLMIPKLNCRYTFGLTDDIQVNFLPGFDLEMLPPAYYPDCIIAMYHIPLNENGKIDIRQVLATLRKSAKAKITNIDYKVPLSIAEDIMESMWTRLLPGNPPSRVVRKGNFLELGGKSLDAVKVIDNVFQFLKLKSYTVEDENRLLSAMFALRFRAVVAELKSVISQRGISAELLEIDHRLWLEHVPQLVPDPFDGEFPVMGKNIIRRNPLSVKEEDEMHVLHRNIARSCYNAPAQFLNTIVYEYDLKLCVDAKVAIARSGLFEGVAVVGSYSGNVIAISLPEVQDQIKTSVKGVDEKTSVKGVNDKNCCLWCITLPDAVEAEATFTKNSTFVFVACHNKCLYAISVADGQITASSLTPGKIRTKPLLTDMGDLIICMDDTNTVTCLDSRNLATIWTALVTDKTFSTYNLVVSSDVVCISTSIGSLIALSTTTKLAQVWTSTDVKNPYSTSPVGFTSKNDSVGIVCGTKYGVKCIDIADGKLKWEYKNTRIVDHGLPPTVHKCDTSPTLEIFIITKRGRVLTFNANGEKIYEFYVNPTNTTPLYMCKSTLKRNPRRNSANEAVCVNKHTHVLLTYPADSNYETRHLLAYQIDKVVTEEKCFDDHELNRDSFSSLVQFEDLIIFGARDNKVHILKAV